MNAAIGDAVMHGGKVVTVLAFRPCENSCCHDREVRLYRASDDNRYWVCEQFVTVPAEFSLTKGVDGQPVITRNGFEVIADGREEIERLFALALLALKVTR